MNPDELKRLQQLHNPDGEPVGHFTGRCSECHSRDLWDDATAYGCNCCGAIFMTGDILPKVVHNLTGQVFEFEDFYGNDSNYNSR